MADVITRFKLETTQYDSKLRDAAKGLSDYARVAALAGNEFDKFTKDQAETARALGSISTSANNAKNKVRELVGAYNQAANAYNALTKEQQQSDWGRALAESINTLKGRITEAKQELYSLGDVAKNGKFGQFGGIIDGIGHKMGISGKLTELLTSKTALLTGAIGAGAAIVGKAAKEWTAYNTELAKQDQITQVTTGLKGDDANNMTDKMRALSDTYKVDFRDAINAANILMSQFGESGESAIQLIKDGMQGMIQGDGPKLLSMIQQYAPAFRDAGVSASQLVAVIQNSEGGIFTDQNMQAIVMGIKNIRLMTNATSDALAKLGIDGQKMSEQMSNGSMTVFDALKQVASQLKTVDSNSQTAGEVMQAVFARQGAMAGTNLAKAIEGLNTDLEQTKKQTGEVGDALADLQTANERLNIAIRDCFEYDGWDQMANGIKSNLITALAAVIEKLAEIRDFFTGENQIKWDIKTKPGVKNVADDPNVDANGNYIRKPNNGGNIKVVQQTVTPDPIVKPTKPTKPTGGNKTPKTEEMLNNEEIQKLTQEYIHASEQRQAAIRDEIKVLQERNELIQALKDQAQGKGFDPSKIQQATDLTGRTPWATPEQLTKGAELTLPVSLTADVEKLKSELRVELNAQNVKVDETALKTLLKDSIQNGINGMDLQLASLSNQIAKGIDVPEEKWQKILDDYNKLRKAIGKTPIEMDFKTGNIAKDGKGGGNKSDVDSFKKFNDKFSQLNGGVSSIVSGIQQMGVEIPKKLQSTLSVLQGISTIMTGILAIITLMDSKQTAQTAMSFVPFFAHGGLVHAATGYMVPGNDHADRTLIAASSGELILNRAQQGVIAGELEGGAGRSVHVTGILRGEDIVLVADRWGRRTGKGELAFFK